MKGFIWSKLHLHSWSASTACQKWTEDTKSVVQSSEEKNQFFLINVAVKKISFLRNVLELKLDKAYRPVASQPASKSQSAEWSILCGEFYYFMTRILCGCCLAWPSSLATERNDKRCAVSKNGILCGHASTECRVYLWRGRRKILQTLPKWVSHKDSFPRIYVNKWKIMEQIMERKIKSIRSLCVVSLYERGGWKLKRMDASVELME